MNSIVMGLFVGIMTTMISLKLSLKVKLKVELKYSGFRGYSLKVRIRDVRVKSVDGRLTGDLGQVLVNYRIMVYYC